MNKLPRTQFEWYAAWLNFILMIALFGWMTFMLLLAVLRISRFGNEFLQTGQMATMLSLFFATFLLLYAKKRGRNQVLKHDFKLCTKCRYPLDGHPEHGRCPECGETYSIEIVQMRWKNAYAIWRVTVRDWLPF